MRPTEVVQLATFLGEGLKASAMEWVMSSMEGGKDDEEEGVKKVQPLDVFFGEGVEF